MPILSLQEEKWPNMCSGNLRVVLMHLPSQNARKMNFLMNKKLVALLREKGR